MVGPSLKVQRMPKTSRESRLSEAQHAFDGGHCARAVEICRALLREDAGWAEAHYLLGLALANLGDLNRAVASLTEAALLLPKNAVLHSDLGVILRRLGQDEEAVAVYRKAVKIDPDLAEGHYNLGNALQAAGQLTAAIEAFLQCLRIEPRHTRAHNNIGLALLKDARPAEAAEHFRGLIAADGQAAYAHNNLANALRDLGEGAAAIESYRRAIALQPDYSEALSNLGVALKESGDLNGAVAAQRQAIKADPQNFTAQANTGSVLFEAGELNAAISSMEAAVEAIPGNAALHWNLALAYLMAGNFSRGWAEYEWRWRKEDFTTPRQNFEQPQWDGSDLQGRSILLHAEQGLGDTIQFIRYAPLVRQRGGRVFVVCQPELKRLLQSAPGIDVLAASGEQVPMFDVHLPMLSLPHVLGTTAANIPADIPYLRPPADAVAKPEISPILKIGIVWAGSATHRHDSKRSINLAALSPLLETKGCIFISLQVGPQRAEIAAAGLSGQMFDVADELHDFADTASAISQLDLLITVDTAVAHLAGALGCPVWLMLSHVPDWRWMMTRSDSPWYPTMKLFRQPAIGDWTAVIEEVRQSLSSAIGQRAV